MMIQVIKASKDRESKIISAIMVLIKIDENYVKYN